MSAKEKPDRFQQSLDLPRMLFIPTVKEALMSFLMTLISIQALALTLGILVYFLKKSTIQLEQIAESFHFPYGISSLMPNNCL